MYIKAIQYCFMYITETGQYNINKLVNILSGRIRNKTAIVHFAPTLFKKM